MTIEYCDRKIWVDWFETKPDLSTGYKGEFKLREVEYKGRNITRLVDFENIQHAVYNHIYQIKSFWI